MNGAIEVAYLEGPIFLDHPYRVHGTVVGVRRRQRLLKASSPLYPELSSDVG